MNKVPSKALLSLLLFIGWVHSCSDDNILNPPPYAYHIPEQTNDGWQTASLEDVGIDESIIGGAIDRINYNLYQNVHGILIVKDGKLVFEEYFSGYKWNYNGDQFRGDSTEFGANTIHNMASVTKSFTSALVGIAIDHGFIQDVDEKVFTFFPEYSDPNNEQKDKIALKHLLSMTAGLEWDEWSYPYSDSRNSHIAMNRSGDPIRYVLKRPVVAGPGETFVYNSGLSITLGGTIFNTSDLRADKFAEKFLFGPLGITDYSWERYPNGTIQTGGGLYLRPRDMAKFGYLYLQDGVWNGRQIISKKWIDESTKAHISVDSEWRYGYQWWLRTYHSNSRNIESFAARGWGGQNIIVFPALNMVVVFTGGNYAAPEPIDEILTRFILPAVL